MALSLALIGVIVVLLIAVLVDAANRAPEPISIVASTVTTTGEARSWVVRSLSKGLRTYGYHLAGQSATQVDFRRTYRSLGVWVVTLMFFPVGLIAFVLFRRSSLCSVVISPRGNGAELLITGEVPRKVAMRLQEIASVPVGREPARPPSVPLAQPVPRQ